jgi:antitoxin CptB
MSGLKRSTVDLDPRRKKILFRAWHRGMREMDLILGSFADAQIDALTGEELAQYERLLEISDTTLLPWITGEQPAPEASESEILQRIAAFRQAMRF